MSRYRSASLPVLGAWDERTGTHRVSRSAAFLVGLALFCAVLTVVFGIWMAGVVPAASIG